MGLSFDVTALFPTGRWGDVWECVRDEVDGDGFVEKVRKISEGAKEGFLREEVRRFIDDPRGWAREIRGPLVKHEIQ
jgi:hypothetical protein